MSVANIQTQLTRANRGYRAAFYEQLESTRARWDPIVNAVTMQVASTGSSEEYNFTDGVPRMAQFKGERNVSRLGVQGFTLTNVEYDNGIEIRRKDLMDDKLGLYMPRIRQLAEMGYLLKLQLIRDLINGGFTSNGYDGTVFFGNSHPLADSSSVNDNLTTGALAEGTFEAALLLLAQMKDSYGEEMGLMATHLLYGSDNIVNAKTLLGQRTLATGEENRWFGAVTPVQIPGLTAGYWVLADLSKPLKPFVLQEREALSFTSVESADHPDVYNRKVFNYGADWRGAAGYAFHELMVGSTG
ncbi:MAG: Mu-like prophage major head subunit gpT family protein [Myxococcales bacterium]|nr:Mu-like prophage major head subunit gpT family protein [Myxococcales bacterium]